MTKHVIANANYFLAPFKGVGGLAIFVFELDIEKETIGNKCASQGISDP